MNSDGWASYFFMALLVVLRAMSLGKHLRLKFHELSCHDSSTFSLSILIVHVFVVSAIGMCVVAPGRDAYQSGKQTTKPDRPFHALLRC
jgi:hypothetical protein